MPNNNRKKPFTVSENSISLKYWIYSTSQASLGSIKICLQIFFEYILQIVDKLRRRGLLCTNLSLVRNAITNIEQTTFSVKVEWRHFRGDSFCFVNGCVRKLVSCFYIAYFLYLRCINLLIKYYCRSWFGIF